MSLSRRLAPRLLGAFAVLVALSVPSLAKQPNVALDVHKLLLGGGFGRCVGALGRAFLHQAVLTHTFSAGSTATTAATTAASVGVNTPAFMPPMITTGNAKAHRPSRTAWRKRAPSNRRPSVGGASFLAHKAQVIHRATPINSPGTIPAKNSLVMDTPPATPKITKPIDGGMMGAMIPPEAIRPAERALS